MTETGDHSKQEQIEQHVLQRIRDGRLKPGGRAPSDAQLARRFGVSTITANKALLALAARGLVERRRGAAGTVVATRLGAMGAIGFVTGRWIGSYFWRLFYGTADALASRGYGIHYINPQAPTPDGNIWRTIANSRLSGVICALTMPPIDLPMPAVLLDFDTGATGRYPTVNSDNEGGGYRMGKHLMEAGHRDVVFISFGSQAVTSVARARGFVRALTEGRVKKAEQRVYPTESGSAGVPGIVHDALRRYSGLTAIATGTDSYAALVIKTLEQQKLRVPRDISVTGFGNLSEMYIMQRITSVEQHPEHMGAQAAARLLDWIAAPDQPPASVVAPCDLVPGDTVAVIHQERLKPGGRKDRG